MTWEETVLSSANKRLYKDYQELQKTNWRNMEYLNGKIEKLEKEVEYWKVKTSYYRNKYSKDEESE